MHFNRLKFWKTLEVFYHFKIFWLKNAKIKFLKKIRVLSAFFKIKVQVISNPSI